MTNPQFVTDAEGKRTAVILDLETYEELIEAREELEDIRAADAAKAEDPEGLSLAEARAEIERMRNSQAAA